MVAWRRLLLAAGFLLSAPFLARSVDRAALAGQDHHSCPPQPPIPLIPDALLKRLPNPVSRPYAAPEEPALEARLLGLLPSRKSPEKGVVFLRSLKTPRDFCVIVGDTVDEEGDPEGGPALWTLVEVSGERVVFVCGPWKRVLGPCWGAASRTR